MAAEAKVPSVREQIPTAEFIEDLTAYMSKEGTAEAVIEKLQRMYSALKFIEQKELLDRAIGVFTKSDEVAHPEDLRAFITGDSILLHLLLLRLHQPTD